MKAFQKFSKTCNSKSNQKSLYSTAPDETTGRSVASAPALGSGGPTKHSTGQLSWAGTLVQDPAGGNPSFCSPVTTGTLVLQSLSGTFVNEREWEHGECLTSSKIHYKVDLCLTSPLSWDVSIFQPKAALARFSLWVMEDKPTKCEGKYTRAEMLSEDRRKLHSIVTLWPLQKKRLGCFWECLPEQQTCEIGVTIRYYISSHLSPPQITAAFGIIGKGRAMANVVLHPQLIRRTASGTTKGRFAR